MNCKTLIFLGVIFCNATVALAQSEYWLTNAPKFPGPGLPESPSQHQAWKAPPTDLPTNLVSSAESLFALGLADPRGGEYREYETVVGSVWGGVRMFKAHGWTFTGVDHQPFAVSWSGLVYPVLHLGEKADLKHDIEALLQADQELQTNRSERIFGRIFSYGVLPEGVAMSETNMTSLKVALLWRLGETNLASRFWSAWLVAGSDYQNHQNDKDPFQTLADDWAWALLDRAICAHERVDDFLAVADCRKLNAAWPKLESAARQRGFTAAANWSTGRAQTNEYIFDFLKPLPALLADEERRIKLPPHPTALQIGLDKFPTKSARISALISNLDEVSARQWGQPGGVDLNFDPIVRALVSEGDEAVDPLLDCLEKDTRLTRSVSFGRDFSPSRHLLSVSNAATAALNEILKVSFQSPFEYRSYWNKYKNLPLTQRWYQTLRDDHAGRRQWMEVAANILSRTDGTNIYLWRNAPRPNTTNHYTYVADSLRTNHSPTVAALLAQRALEIAPTNYLSSEQCWTFDDATKLGLMLAEWDPKAAVPALRNIIQRCPALFPNALGEWTTGCAVVPSGLAQLADATALLGDTSGLDLYAKWIENKSYTNLDDALPGVLAPLGLFPNHPSIQQASARLFSPDHHEWVDRDGYSDLLKTRLILNQPFRALVLQALTDTSSNGTIVLKEKDYFDLRTQHTSQGGVLKPDSFAPKIGETVSFRVCDCTAYRLARIQGLPEIELYWPEKKRDEAVASIVNFLKENSDHLKLKPADWRSDEED